MVAGPLLIGYRFIKRFKIFGMPSIKSGFLTKTFLKQLRNPPPSR
jgi:hypothetical protein